MAVSKNHRTMDKLFFIVGVGRSGTTLLQGMLNAHPLITLPPESHFFREYVVDEIKNQKAKRPDLDRITEIFLNDTYLARLKLDIRKIMDPYYRGEKGFSYRALFLEVLEEYAKFQKKSIVGEKDPSNSHYITEIHEAYPNAIIVHVIRDPRDIILSRLKTVPRRKASFWRYIFNNQMTLKNALQFGRSLPDSLYIEVFYENLVSEPQRTLKKICDKLNLPFHEAMLQFYKNSKDIVSEDEMAWKKNVLKPLMADNIRKWEKGLTMWQVIAIERIFKNEMVRLGYAFSGFRNPLIQLAVSPPLAFYHIAAYLKKSSRL
jgi:hypothetical protein